MDELVKVTNTHDDKIRLSVELEIGEAAVTQSVGGRFVYVERVKDGEKSTLELIDELLSVASIAAHFAPSGFIEGTITSLRDVAYNITPIDILNAAAQRVHGKPWEPAQAFPTSATGELQ